jgi:uncharacterized protein YmfQ (DUF2313 family)
MDAAAYLDQLQALLPPGAAWPREADATLTALLSAWAEELARVDARASDLVEEADPRTTFELLPDWERVAGVPAPCLEGLDQTVQQRRNALVGQLTALGGASRAYFIGVAAALGFEIAITEFRPHTVNDDVEAEILGDSWAFAWRVNSAEAPVIELVVTDDVEQPLAAWGNDLLECALGRLKPAHTVLLFTYT